MRARVSVIFTFSYSTEKFVLMFILSFINYSALVGEQSIAISLSVCVCVCLSTSISLDLLDRSSQKFVRRSPVANVRSSSGGVAICYVLPVLWMTSRLTVVCRMVKCD